MATRDLVFTPRKSVTHHCPRLVVGDRVRVTTTYTYQHNYTRTGRVIAAHHLDAIDRYSYAIAYDGGLSGYVGDSEYYRVVCVSRGA